MHVNYIYYYIRSAITIYRKTLILYAKTEVNDIELLYITYINIYNMRVCNCLYVFKF